MSYELHVTVALHYPFCRYWGCSSVYAVVRATVGKDDGTELHQDVTDELATGVGYDKVSSAICRAFQGNKVLETFALWRGFNPNTKAHDLSGVEKRDYGYAYVFAGMGVGVLDSLMRANGFRSSLIYDNGDTLVACDFWRTIPADFLELF